MPPPVRTRILIVEDDGSAAERLSAKLQKFSYEVVGVAVSRAQAKALFTTTNPDLVIMDIKLRGGGEYEGIETAEELKAEKDVPIIFISGYTDDATVERAKAIQPFGYIPKSVNSPALLKISIEMALSNHRAARSSIAHNHGDKVFISYAHDDRDMLKELNVHLAPLQNTGIKIWTDENIPKGSIWRDEIKKALDSARLGILLVSAPFLASQFIRNNELPLLLDRAGQHGTRILYVVVRPCRVPETITRWQAINGAELAMSEMSSAQRDRVWMILAEQVEHCFK